MVSMMERLGAAMRVDGWENVILGLGGSKDPSAYTTFGSRAQLADQLMEALYIEDHFAAKIIEALPRDAMRPGWDLQVPGKPDDAAKLREAYAARELELGVAAEMAQGACWGRVFGGAVTWIGADDGQAPKQLLNEDGIRSIRFLHTFDRRDVHIWSYYQDPAHPKFRRPEIFRITPQLVAGHGGGGAAELGGGVLVHESRCVVWGGQSTTDQRRHQLSGWDDSIFERCWDALRQVGEDYGAKSLLLGRVSQAIYKLKGLYAMIAGNQEAVLKRRMGLLDASRSRARAIVLDTEEDFANVTQPIGGVSDLLEKSILRLAASANMPVTRLMGQSPAGMDATGESDLEIWSTEVDGWRALELKPKHDRVALLIMLAKDGPTSGKPPAGWGIVYRPIRVPTQKELAETNKLHAEADALNIDKGVYSAEVAAFRYGPKGIAGLVLDADELEERLERRRELAKNPPKDNAELGTVAPRTTAVLDVQERLYAGAIPRSAAVAILVELQRFTPEAAEELLGPEGFVAPAWTSTPGPEPDPQSGQGAGAPPSQGAGRP